jgi:hypothetical protein
MVMIFPFFAELIITLTFSIRLTPLDFWYSVESLEVTNGRSMSVSDASCTFSDSVSFLLEPVEFAAEFAAEFATAGSWKFSPALESAFDSMIFSEDIFSRGLGREHFLKYWHPEPSAKHWASYASTTELVRRQVHLRFHHPVDV